MSLLEDLRRESSSSYEELCKENDQTFYEVYGKLREKFIITMDKILILIKEKKVFGNFFMPFSKDFKTPIVYADAICKKFNEDHPEYPRVSWSVYKRDNGLKPIEWIFIWD